MADLSCVRVSRTSLRVATCEARTEGLWLRFRLLLGFKGLGFKGFRAFKEFALILDFLGFRFFLKLVAHVGFSIEASGVAEQGRTTHRYSAKHVVSYPKLQ